MDAVVFIPGFFGFGAFGHPDRPFVEYFAQVEKALLRANVASPPPHFVVHEPPPTGSLEERVGSLHDTVAKTAASGVARLHLVGHSSGGLDARLFANRLYRGAPPRDDLLKRLATVVTLSAPFHGTPLARRLLLGADFAMPTLWFASILASRRRLRLAGQLGTLFNLGKRLVMQKPTPTDQMIAALADVDDETATQIRRFLLDVSRDHPLVSDITPESMAALNREIAGGDSLPLHSFVTLSPRPGLGLRDAIAFVTAPAQRLLYDAAYALSSTGPRGAGKLPSGPWIGEHRIPVRDDSSDGIVPAWSQTLDGRADGLVTGDHLDVIGHYEAAGATFLRSGSQFDDARFRALWARIAALLAP